MRLFTGISIPREAIHHLTRLLDHLRPTAQIKWLPVYNLHVTLKFIGAWPDERLDEIVAKLGGVPVPGPVEININGLGWFPNPHHPRVLWAAVRAPETLARLAKATDETLQSLGIAAETKPFTPHLTLATVKEPHPLIELKRTIAALPSVDFGNFTASHFHLFRSTPGPAGSIYTHLAEFPLTKT